MQLKSICFLGVASVMLATPLAAQTLSYEEIEAKMLAQREAMTLGATRSILGGSRGVNFVEIGETTTETTDPGVTATASTAPAPTDPNLPLVNVAVRFNEEMTLDVRIDFEFDSAVIDASQTPELDRICQVMNKNTQIEKLRIVGHTDSSGSDEYNERLSRLRAEEVGRYMTNTCGVAPSRLETVGYGEQFLVDGIDPEAPENRRVEFQTLG